MPATPENPIPTTLHIGTRDAFDALPDAASLPHVHTLHLGARLYGAVPFALLCAWVVRLPALHTIYLADDWIPDAQMASVGEAFANALPGKAFHWTYDALAGGKHGR